MRGVRVGIAFLVVLALSAAVSCAAEYVISSFETDGDLAQWEATGCIDPCNPGNPDSGAPSPATLSRAFHPCHQRRLWLQDGPSRRLLSWHDTGAVRLPRLVGL